MASSDLYLTTEGELTSVADAIRSKGGASGLLVYPDEYIVAIQNINSGSVIVSETEDEHGGTIVEITGGALRLQSKSATPTTSAQVIVPDTGYNGLNRVNLAAIPSEYIIPSGSDILTTNGTYDVTSLASVDVDVSSSIIRSLSVTPTTSEQVFTATDSSARINTLYFTHQTTQNFSTPLVVGQHYIVHYKEYYVDSQGRIFWEQTTEIICQDTLTAIGDNIPGYISNTQLQNNGSNSFEHAYEIYNVQTDGYCPVTVAAIPSEYIIPTGTVNITSAGTTDVTAYASASISSTTLAQPTVSIDSSGLITASVSQTAGFISASSSSKTLQLTTQAAKTVTPTTSSQTAVTSQVYTTGTVTVAAIPSQYKDISGVTATASDVLSGKSFVNSSGATTNGTLVIQHYYTGSGTPSAATGSNGDIYLKTS